MSPSWYASKAEHGRGVPTWNYEAVQLRGSATVHTDEARLRAAVVDLTARDESDRPHPWQVTDAPEACATGQLRGIVGLEIQVQAVAAKSTMSQNRSAADLAGVIAGSAPRKRGQRLRLLPSWPAGGARSTTVRSPAVSRPSSDRDPTATPVAQRTPPADASHLGHTRRREPR